MSGRNHSARIHIPLQNKQGDHFVLTDENLYHNEPLGFRSNLDAWEFLSDLQGSNDLEQKLSGHPLIQSHHHQPTAFLIQDALVRGNLRVFVTHRNQAHNRQEIEKLYSQIRLQLQQIIASEKAEASAIAGKYNGMTDSEQNLAHTGSFGKGLKEAGTSFLIWAKDVVEVVSPAFRSARRVKAFMDTPYEGSVFEWLKSVSQTYHESEYKELIEVLGFDPRKVETDHFRQAWEITQVIWDDKKCQTLLVQFAKEYYRAQHPLEVSEFAGGAAFEILLTIVLIFTTAGVGIAAQMTSKGRLVKQLTQLGEFFKELAELRQEADRWTPETRMRSRSSGGRVEDFATDEGAVYKTSNPPKEEQKTNENSSKKNDSDQTNEGNIAVTELKQQSTIYAELVNSNKPWSWKDFPEGGELTLKQKRAIKAEAIAQGLIPDIKYKEGTQYPDFEAAGLIKRADDLPEELWKESDYKQFKWLDSRIDGGRPEGYTWHHSEISGKMELVPFGPHNSINHKGGRSKGHWADAKR